MRKPEHILHLLDSLTWKNDWVSRLEQTTPRDEELLETVTKLRNATADSLTELSRLAFRGHTVPITIEDIAHCNRHIDVLREVAIHNAGFADLKKTAELIIEARMTTAAQGDITSNLHNFVTDNQEWTPIREHQAWLLIFGPVPADFL